MPSRPNSLTISRLFLFVAASLSHTSSFPSQLLYSRCRSRCLSHLHSVAASHTSILFLSYHSCTLTLASQHLCLTPTHDQSRSHSRPLPLLVVTLCGVDECTKGFVNVGLDVEVCVFVTFFSLSFDASRYLLRIETFFFCVHD